MKVRDILSCAALLFVCVWVVWSAVRRGSDADVYPSKYITLICPFSAGGGTDLLCRTIAAELYRNTGSPVAVSNVRGGAGALGFVQGARADADAYTLTMLTFEINPLSLRGFVPVSAEDFDFIALLNSDPACIAVPADSPIKNLADFISEAAKRKISVGNSGVGSVWHLGSESFAEKSGISITGVPFEGASGAATAMLGGHIDAVCVSAAELKSHADSGKVRILAVMCRKRLAAFPDVPTCAEYGIDAEFSTWRAIAVPKGTPNSREDFLRDKLREFSSSTAARDFAQRTGPNMQFEDGRQFLKEVARQEGEIKSLMKKLKLLK